MTKPRYYTQAKNYDWIISNIYANGLKIRVTMKPRFGVGIANFWLTYKGAKRLNINF